MTKLIQSPSLDWTSVLSSLFTPLQIQGSAGTFDFYDFKQFARHHTYLYR